MHRELTIQDQGRGDVVHGKGRGYTAFKKLISMEGQGERAEGFVVHQVRSNIGGKTLQEDSSQEKARSIPVR